MSGEGTTKKRNYGNKRSMIEMNSPSAISGRQQRSSGINPTARCTLLTSEPQAEVKMKVLVVEDNADLLEMLGTWLETEKWEVVMTLDGAEALAAVAQSIKTKPFTLMIVDVSMMYVDGYAFAKAVRCFETNGLTPKVSIWFNTAHTEAFRNRGLLEQAQVTEADCFTKPDDMERLFERLKELTQ